MRIKLTVAYDGTNYHGSQYQPNLSTIEGELNKAISDLVKAEIQVIGASRTDTGVHARGSVFVFDTESSIEPEKFALAINARLPEDIRVMKSVLVSDDFHPRFDCHNKTYSYRISRGRIQLPTKRLYAYNVSYTLDVNAMRMAAQSIVGEHDFAAFCAAGATVESTVRTVYSLEVIEEQEDLIIKIQGNGFLYNMVRIIAGTLCFVGIGKLKPEEISSIIASKDRTKAGPTAPAHALTLESIDYGQ